MIGNLAGMVEMAYTTALKAVAHTGVRVRGPLPALRRGGIAQVAEQGAFNPRVQVRVLLPPLIHASEGGDKE